MKTVPKYETRRLPDVLAASWLISIRERLGGVAGGVLAIVRAGGGYTGLRVAVILVAGIGGGVATGAPPVAAGVAAVQPIVVGAAGGRRLGTGLAGFVGPPVAAGSTASCWIAVGAAGRRRLGLGAAEVVGPPVAAAVLAGGAVGVVGTGQRAGRDGGGDAGEGRDGGGNPGEGGNVAPQGPEVALI